MRKKVAGTAQTPRLVVNRSARHIHVQLVDDLEGVTLAAREIVHLLSNDLSLAVGAMELMRLQPDLTPNALVLLRQAESGLNAADRHLRSLQKVVRVRTKETPIGPALDLAQSTSTNPT